MFEHFILRFDAIVRMNKKRVLLSKCPDPFLKRTKQKNINYNRIINTKR